MSDVRKKLRAKNKQKIKDKDSGQFAGRTLRADVRCQARIKSKNRYQ